MRRFGFSGWSGSLLLSTYVDGLELRIADGSIAEILPYRPDSAPPRGDESAIPPDLIAHLAFSELGAAGLEVRHADVVLGEQRTLMRTLFPTVTSDLLLY